MEIVGIYHSHPVGASPSGVDLKFMEIHSYAVWLIRGHVKSNQDIRAYQMFEGHLIDVDIEIVD